MAVAAASYVRSLLALGPERFARECSSWARGGGIYVLPFPGRRRWRRPSGPQRSSARPARRSLVLAVAVLATLVVAGVVGAAARRGTRRAPSLGGGGRAHRRSAHPLGALAIFRRRGRTRSSPDGDRRRHGAVLYPRPDFAHLMQIAPLLLPLALLLWRTMVEPIAVLRGA